MAKKRPDGRYKASIVIDGNAKYLYGKSSKEALDKSRSISMLKVAPNLDESVTFGQWAVIWLHEAKTPFRKYVCVLHGPDAPLSFTCLCKSKTY